MCVNLYAVSHHNLGANCGKMKCKHSGEALANLMNASGPLNERKPKCKSQGGLQTPGGSAAVRAEEPVGHPLCREGQHRRGGILDHRCLPFIHLHSRRHGVGRKGPAG